MVVSLVEPAALIADRAFEEVPLGIALVSGNTGEDIIWIKTKGEAAPWILMRKSIFVSWRSIPV